MFLGVINKRLVFSCHPVFVVCREGVVGAFSDLAGAQEFISHRGTLSGLIYRHNGVDWDRVTDEDASPPTGAIRQASR
jgi:hypothetical protein